MKIGFIGLGNMAKAMIGGMLQKEIVQTGDIFGSARSRETLEAYAPGTGSEHGTATWRWQGRRMC